MMKRLLLALATACSLALLTACDDDTRTTLIETVPDETSGTIQTNIVDTAINAGSFTTLVAALEATGLDDVLADENAEFTVFAPTDAAFDALGADTINALLADTPTLSTILQYHVLSGSVDSATALTLDGQSVETVSGSTFSVSVNGGNLFINDAQVVTADIEATNGVIHVIDSVLLPPEEAPMTLNIVETATAAGSFNTLLAALSATGLDNVLASTGTFTVFAPTDDAFAALGTATINALLADTDALSAILTYHVLDSEVEAATALTLDGQVATTVNGSDFALTVDNGSLYINNALVSATDIMASNGIIHVIDTVLLPPVDTADATLNIVETAQAAGSFTTLIAALEATGLDAALASTSTFTVFAPTDDAFAALGTATISALLEDTDTLSAILQYHVITPAVVNRYAAITLNGSDVATLNGASVTVTFDGGDLLINSATVTGNEIAATNGIIHVIDAVLLP